MTTTHTIDDMARQLLDVPDRDGEAVLYDADLTSGAARLAASRLTENWEAALGDGTALAELIGDVDIVVGLLNRWRDKVVQQFAPSAQSVTGERTYDEHLNLVANLRELVPTRDVIASRFLTPTLIYAEVGSLRRILQPRSAALILALVDALECAQADMTGLIADGYDGNLDAIDGVRETYAALCRITGEQSRFDDGAAAADGEGEPDSHPLDS